MSVPLLSVCLITYNQAQYIEQAIECVLMQQVNFPIELIIADDCSTDGTREIVMAYKQKRPDLIKLILQEKNVGAAKNWVDLIAAPGGKYVAYFEGDDYWTDPYKLQKQVDFLEKTPECSLCHHDVLTLNRDCTPNKNIKSPTKYTSRVYDVSELAHGNFIITVSVVFKRILIENLPTWLPEAPMGDYPLFMLAGKFGKIGYIQQTMAVYRVYGGIWSNLQENEKYIKWIRMVSLLQQEFEDMPVVRARLHWSILRHQKLLLQAGRKEATADVEKCTPAMLESFSYMMNEMHENMQQKNPDSSLRNRFRKNAKNAIRKILNW